MLYINRHEPLAYDEIAIFRDLGWDVERGLPDGTIPAPASFRPVNVKSVTWDAGTVSSYDCVIVVHWVDTLTAIYDAMEDKQRLIWRTIGQTRPHEEQIVRLRAPGARKIRYSPRERLMEPYSGETAVIRFGKSPDEFGGWSGGSGRVMVMGNGFGSRRLADHDLMLEALEELDWDLYGRGNNANPNAVGLVTYEQLKAGLRSASAYFYPHSAPAPYTLNFMEALMTGVPVVAWSRETIEDCWMKHPRAPGLAGKLYEIDGILKNGENGFVVNDPREARTALLELLRDPALAARIGQAGRETAIRFFDVERTKKGWQDVLSALAEPPNNPSGRVWRPWQAILATLALRRDPPAG